MRTVFLTLLSLTLQIAYGQNQDVVKYLIKDTAVVAQVKSGIYQHPALEIAMKTEFRETARMAFPIRVAIDPGHVATTKKEALLEERFIKSRHGFFYESELNMATALVLKKLLEDRGFEVMITRTPKTTALGMSYTTWYKKYADEHLCNDLEIGKISRQQYEEYRDLNKRDLFHRYFKDKDFIARKELINAFQPDVTLVIHYNATEFENKENTFAPEVDYNYTVAFVPGSFTNQELASEAQLHDFIRLASTDMLQNSIKLSAFIVDEFNRKLNVPKLVPTDLPDLWYLKRFSVYTGTPGVFSRNLYLTRAISSPVCYGEAILQNNKEEIKALAKRDYSIKPYRVSSRVVDVANCYYTGTIKYFQDIGWLK